MVVLLKLVMTLNTQKDKKLLFMLLLKKVINSQVGHQMLKVLKFIKKSKKIGQAILNFMLNMLKSLILNTIQMVVLLKVQLHLLLMEQKLIFLLLKNMVTSSQDGLQKKVLKIILRVLLLLLILNYMLIGQKLHSSMQIMN